MASASAKPVVVYDTDTLRAATLVLPHETKFAYLLMKNRMHEWLEWYWNKRASMEDLGDGKFVPLGATEAVLLMLKMSAAGMVLDVDAGPMVSFEIIRMLETRNAILGAHARGDPKAAQRLWLRHAHYVMASANPVLAEEALEHREIHAAFPWERERDARAVVGSPLPSAAWRSMLVTTSELLKIRPFGRAEALLGPMRPWHKFPLSEADDFTLYHAIAAVEEHIREPRLAAFAGAMLESLARLDSSVTRRRGSTVKLYDATATYDALSRGASASASASRGGGGVLPPLPVGTALKTLLASWRDTAMTRVSKDDMRVIVALGPNFDDDYDADKTDPPAAKKRVFVAASTAGHKALKAAEKTWLAEPSKTEINEVFAAGVSYQVFEEPPTTMTKLLAEMRRGGSRAFAQAAIDGDTKNTNTHKELDRAFDRNLGLQDTMFSEVIPSTFQHDVGEVHEMPKWFKDMPRKRKTFFSVAPAWAYPAEPRLKEYASYFRGMVRRHGTALPARALNFDIIHANAAAAMGAADGDARVVARLFVTDKTPTTLLCRVRGSDTVFIGSTNEATQKATKTSQFPTIGKEWDIFSGADSLQDREFVAPFIAMWAIEMLLHDFGALEIAHLVEVFQGATDHLFAYITNRWAPERLATSTPAAAAQQQEDEGSDDEFPT